MVGLIGVLTPVLYTHISDRKQEIANINKANTMLQLQRETEQFLKDKDKRESLVFTDGKATLSPSGLNSNLTTLNNKYQIGFKQNGDNISAVIVEKEGSGNDVKAAKIANLIGVSAGIKSAMDTDNAYGVNGLWKEALADYGVENVPDGSTVVTTEYNKEKRAFYTSDMLVDSDIDMEGHDIVGVGKMSSNKICIGEDCISEWSEVSAAEASDFEVIAACMKDINNGMSGSASSNCSRASDKGLLSNCGTIASAYKASGLRAPSGYYYLGGSFTKKVCYFVDGAVPTSARQVIEGCNDNTNEHRKFACMYDRQASGFGAYSGGGYTASCGAIFSADNTFTTGYYTLTTNSSGSSYTPLTPCVFASGEAANDAVIAISQCNSGSEVACVWAAMNNKNKSCANIKTVTTSSGYYRIVSSYTKGETGYNVVAQEQGCYFNSSGNLASAAEAVTACNNAGSNYGSNAACAYAYQNGWNTSCANILTASTSFAGSTNRLMVGVRVTGGTSTCVGDCKEIGESATAATECCSGRLDQKSNLCTAICPYGTTNDNKCCPADKPAASGNNCYECSSTYPCPSGKSCSNTTAGTCSTTCTCLGTSKVCDSATSWKQCNGCTYGAVTACSSGQYCLGAGDCTTITATLTRTCPEGFTEKSYTCGGYTEKWCVSNSTMEVTKAYAACGSAGLGLMTDVIATTGCGVGIDTDTSTRVYKLVGTNSPVWISTVGLTKGNANGLYAYGFGYGTGSMKYFNGFRGYHYYSNGSSSNGYYKQFVITNYPNDYPPDGLYAYGFGYSDTSMKYFNGFRGYHYYSNGSSSNGYYKQFVITNYPNDGTRANATRAAYAIYIGACAIKPNTSLTNSSGTTGAYCNPPTRAVLCYHGVSSCSVTYNTSLTNSSGTTDAYCNPMCPTSGKVVCGPL